MQALLDLVYSLAGLLVQAALCQPWAILLLTWLDEVAAVAVVSSRFFCEKQCVHAGG